MKRVPLKDPIHYEYEQYIIIYMQRIVFYLQCIYCLNKTFNEARLLLKVLSLSRFSVLIYMSNAELEMIAEADGLRLSEERKKEEYMVAVCCVFNFFADTLEVITPGVITQSVSCELTLNKTHETILTVALYVSLPVSSFITSLVSNLVPRRTLILFSSYLAVIVTVLCACIPNFVTLVLSRVLLGTSVAINYIIVSVYATEMIHDRTRYVLTMSLCTTALSVAGGWIGVLSYLILERVGWRVFIVLTSLPFFFPQLILLQFFLPDSKKYVSVLSALKEDDSDSALVQENDGKRNRNVYAFISKMVLACFVGNMMGNGAVILVPAFTKAHNLANDVDSPCGKLHGSQFLFFTVTFGVCHLLGRLISYISQDRVKTVIQNFFSYSVCFIACCAMVVYSENLTVLVICEGIIQLYNAHHGSVVFFLSHSIEYIGHKHIALSSAMTSFGCFTGSLVGTVLSAIIDYKLVLIINLPFAGLNYFLLFYIYIGNIKIF